MAKHVRITIKNDTVYEIDKRTGRMVRIVHGVSDYFKMRQHEGDDEVEIEDDYEEYVPTEHEKHEKIHSLLGNKKKLVTKADGLKKEIPIDETEHEPIIKRKLHRNKKLVKIKSKRKSIKKTKGCRCK
jgi:hypothetical protein